MAIELSQELEHADRDIQLLQSKLETETTMAGPVYHVAGTMKSDSTRTVTCFRCGTLGHVVTKCKFRRDVVRHNCGKTGHVKKACRLKLPQAGNKSSVQSTHNNRSNNLDQCVMFSGSGKRMNLSNYYYIKSEQTRVHLPYW